MAGALTIPTPTIGSYSESIISSPTNIPGATGVWGNATTLSLVTGDYDLTSVLSLYINGATITDGTIRMAISVNSGATTTDHVNGSNQVELILPVLNINRSACVPSYRLVLSSTSTVYLKIQATYIVATPQFTARLSARRIA